MPQAFCGTWAPQAPKVQDPAYRSASFFLPWYRLQCRGGVRLGSVRRGSVRGKGYRLQKKYHYVRRRPVWLKLLPILIIACGALITVLFTMGFLDRVDPVRITQLLRPSRQPALRELSNEGRYAEVLNWSAEVLADKPLDSEAWLFRGIAHFYLAVAPDDGAAGGTGTAAGAGLDAAIAALRRARLDEDLRYGNESAYLLGKAYYHKGGFYYGAAIRHFTEALQGGHEPPDVREYLGMAYVRMGDLDTGMEHFATALQRQPNALLFLSVGQLLARMSRPEDALEHFHAAVDAAAEPEIEVRARLMLGKVQLEHGRYAAARDQFQQILEIVPGSADAFVFLGDAYAGLGDIVQARAQWRRARSIDRQHHGANLRLRG